MSSTDRIHVTRSRAKPGGTAAEAEGTVPFRRARKPPWLKVPAPGKFTLEGSGRVAGGV